MPEETAKAIVLETPRRRMAHGIGLVFPEKRKAHVYRKISAWHDYSFTTFPYWAQNQHGPAGGNV